MISATYHCPQHDTFSMTLYSDTAPVYLDCPTCGLPSGLSGPPIKDYGLTLENIQAMKDQLIGKAVDPNELPGWISYKFSWQLGNTPKQEQQAQESAEKKKQVHEALAREEMRRAIAEFTLPVDTGTDNLRD